MSAIFNFVVVDVDAHVDSHEILTYAAAQQRQVLEHWSLYHEGLGLVRAASAHPAQSGEVEIRLLDQPTMDGALGFHDETENGTPIIYVFVGLAKQLGESWTSIASHEVLEVLGDPYLRRASENMDDGLMYAFEVADAVEQQTYEIDGVELSNFCTPAWFEPPHSLDGVKFDHLGLCTAPFQVLEGGYAQSYDTSKGWNMLGQRSAYRSALANLDLGLSRGERRVHASQEI